MSHYITLYGVRSVEDPTRWRSYSNSFTRGAPFEDAQFWRNPRSAAKEARYQEERREWSKQHTKTGMPFSYMGQCEVVPIRIEEPTKG